MALRLTAPDCLKKNRFNLLHSYSSNTGLTFLINSNTTKKFVNRMSICKLLGTYLI